MTVVWRIYEPLMDICNKLSDTIVKGLIKGLEWQQPFKHVCVICRNLKFVFSCFLDMVETNTLGPNKTYRETNF